MESMCTRCARLVLRSDRGVGHGIPQLSVRRFSTTLWHQQDNDADGSKVPPPHRDQPERSPRDAMRSATSNASNRPLVRRQSVDGSNPRTSRPQSAEGGLIIRRTVSPAGSSSGPGGPLLRRSGGAPQQGQLLRHTGGQPQTGASSNRFGGSRTPGTGAQRGRGQQGGQQRRRGPVRQRHDDDHESKLTNAELDKYVTKHIDRPEYPTAQTTYNPTPQTTGELQKDWPNTPLSSTGLTASVVQRIEWLARRLPHGYHTPGQLAEHLQKGNLTRFESSKEKQLVIRAAQELAKKRAEVLTERKGEQIAPEDMNIVSIKDKSEDAAMLVDSLVKGKFPELDKQRMPFLDTIVRTLRNNETYNSLETDKFMSKVQSLMPAQGPRKGTAAQKAA